MAVSLVWKNKITSNIYQKFIRLIKTSNNIDKTAVIINWTKEVKFTLFNCKWYSFKETTIKIGNNFIQDKKKIHYRGKNCKN